MLTFHFSDSVPIDKLEQSITIRGFRSPLFRSALAEVASLEDVLTSKMKGTPLSNYMKFCSDPAITLSCRYLEKVRRNEEEGIPVDSDIDDKNNFLQRICDEGKYHRTEDNVVVYSKIAWDVDIG